MRPMPPNAHNLNAMDSKDKTILQTLLTQEENAALGVIVDTQPYVSMVPFVYWPERTLCIIHTSSLARHSAGLYSGAPYSLMVMDTHWRGNALQTPRVTLCGETALLLPNTTLHQNAQKMYLARFPHAKITFTLKDFSLFGLYVREARLVAGFGRAYTLTTEALKAIFEANT